MSDVGKISYTPEEIEGVRLEILDEKLFEDAKTEALKALEESDTDAEPDDDEEDKLAQEHLDINRERLTKEYLEECKPGTFYCHEAIDRTSVVQNMLSTMLLEHPSIVADPEFFKLAHDAQTAIYNLYQVIGDKHLTEI